MIDALLPALDVLGTSIGAAAKAAYAASAISRVGAGKASYVAKDCLAGNNDPGGEEFARLLGGLAFEGC